MTYEEEQLLKLVVQMAGHLARIADAVDALHASLRRIEERLEGIQRYLDDYADSQ